MSTSLVGDQIYERFGLVFLASVGSRYQLVLLLSERGEFTEAAIHGNEAVRIAELANHPYNLYTAYYAVGYLHLRKGAIDKAIGALEHSLEICRLWNIRQNLPRVAAALGYAYAAAGRVGEALPLLDLANDGRIRLTSTRVQLAQGYLLIGKPEEAALIASHALDTSRRHAELGREAEALYVLGELALSVLRRISRKRKKHYRQAIALADEHRDAPARRALPRRSWKTVSSAPVISSKAKEHLTNGVAMMREMEMGLWLERAEAELKAAN